MFYEINNMEKVKNSYDVALQILATLTEVLELLQEKNTQSDNYFLFCDCAIRHQKQFYVKLMMLIL